MTCLVGHPPPLRLHPAGTTTTQFGRSQHLAGDRLRIAPSLRIAPGHSGLHRSSRLPTTDYSTTEWLLPPWQDYQMGTHLPTNPSYPTVYPIWQPTGLFFHLVFPLPFLYTRWFMPIDAKQLGNHRCQYHGSILLRFQSVFIVFCNIPQNS